MNKLLYFLTGLTVLTMLFCSGLSRADESLVPVSYALLVGSDRPGDGQQQLQFAKKDAQRMKSVLNKFGNYSQKNISVLQDPDGWQLMQALDEFEQILEKHAQNGEQSVFLFYYSGHARANALNLGDDEVELSLLKRRLDALPSTVTLVILDACQTGAISDIKGVQPAADFSYNSVAGLNIEGMAVMASSSSSELSQESSKLRGSFFTHNLIVGMRGAADKDKDGRVSLSEAYSYAYNQTLSATAATAVGKQHVTLETDLKGKGDMILSWPDKTSAAIGLESSLEGEITITHVKSKNVVAEVHKVKGDELKIAFAPGSYEILIMENTLRAQRCRVLLAKNETTFLNPRQCDLIKIENAPPKGVTVEAVVVKARPKPQRKEHLALEFTLSWFKGQSTGYIKRLTDFGYRGVTDSKPLIPGVSIVYTPIKYLSVSAGYSLLDDRYSNRNLVSQDENTVEWKTRRLGLYTRGNLPFLKGLLIPYVQIGGGWAWSDFVFNYANHDNSGVSQETKHSYHLGASVGLQINPWKHAGFVFPQIEYVYSPSLKNEMNQVHNSGGFMAGAGMRAGF